MKLKMLSVLTAVMLLLGFTSCDSGSNLVQWSNYVTYLGLQNGMPALQWQGINDSETITVFMNGPSSEFTPGERLFVMFYEEADATLANNSTITPSTVFSLPTIETSYFTPGEPGAAPQGWAEESQLTLQVLFRTGSFLNLQALLPAGSSVTGMRWNFFVDNNTLNSDNIEAYLSYYNEASNQGAANIYTYMSCINIGPLMNTGAKTLTVHINNNYTGANPGWGPEIGQASDNGKIITIPMPRYFN